MKKLLLLIVPIILFVACDNDEQKTTQDDVLIKKKEPTVLYNVSDFPMPLQTFIDTYNKSQRDGFTPIEKDATEIEFTEETLGYSKTLISEETESTDYSLTAMFNDDKKFKRITYTQIIKDTPSEKANVTLLALFDTLEIDTNYIEDFLVTENEHMHFTTENYDVRFQNMSSTDILNVAIDANAIDVK